MEQKPLDNLSNEIDKLNDELYQQTKQAVTHGHRLPYKEYVRERAKYYIKVLASPEDLTQLKQALEERMTTTS